MAAEAWTTTLRQLSDKASEYFSTNSAGGWQMSQDEGSDDEDVSALNQSVADYFGVGQSGGAWGEEGAADDALNESVRQYFGLEPKGGLLGLEKLTKTVSGAVQGVGKAGNKVLQTATFGALGKKSKAPVGAADASSEPAAKKARTTVSPVANRTRSVVKRAPPAKKTPTRSQKQYASKKQRGGAMSTRGKTPVKKAAKKAPHGSASPMWKVVEREYGSAEHGDIMRAKSAKYKNMSNDELWNTFKHDVYPKSKEYKALQKKQKKSAASPKRTVTSKRTVSKKQGGKVKKAAHKK